MTARPTSWPCPIAFDHGDSVRNLQALTGNPDAAIYALRLWQHRRRVSGAVASVDMLVRIACEGRTRRGLAEALVACRLVSADPAAPGGYLIRPWEETGFVDWTRSGGEAPKKELTPEQIRKSDARKAADKARKAADRAADRARPQDVRNVSAADDSAEGDAKVPESLDIPLAGTRATATGTSTGTGTAQVQEPSSVGTDLFGGTATSTPAKPKKEPLAPTGDVAIVWTAYAAHHPTAKFTPDRDRLIRKTLALGYTADDLVRTIDGYHRSPHHMGENDRQEKYLDLELFLRDAKRIEGGWKYLAAAGPQSAGPPAHVHPPVFVAPPPETAAEKAARIAESRKAREDLAAAGALSFGGGK